MSSPLCNKPDSFTVYDEIVPWRDTDVALLVGAGIGRPTGVLTTCPPLLPDGAHDAEKPTPAPAHNGNQG
jgi:hypothetical protein